MNSFYTDTYIEWKLRTFTVMSHSTFLQQFRESNGFTEEIVKRVNLAKYSVKSMISSFLVKRMFSRKKVRYSRNISSNTHVAADGKKTTKN